MRSVIGPESETCQVYRYSWQGLTREITCFKVSRGPGMWNLFKRRHEDDLRRVISAYRCFLKAAQQAEAHGQLAEQELESRKWKGGFGKAFNQLFREWPTPDQSRRFEKIMQRWQKKVKDTDQAFIMSFNEYLGQKRFNTQELNEVLDQGRRVFTVNA